METQCFEDKECTRKNKRTKKISSWHMKLTPWFNVKKVLFTNCPLFSSYKNVFIIENNND